MRTFPFAILMRICSSLNDTTAALLVEKIMFKDSLIINKVVHEDLLSIQDSASLVIAAPIEKSKVFQRKFPDSTKRFKISKNKFLLV
jgi:hypothetical protein